MVMRLITNGKEGIIESGGKDGGEVDSEILDELKAQREAKEREALVSGSTQRLDKDSEEATPINDYSGENDGFAERQQDAVQFTAGFG